MGAEEGGILTKVRSEKTMADNPGYNPHSGEYLLKGGLDGVDWVKELKAEPGATTVLSVGAMASQGGDIDPDHMVCARVGGLDGVDGDGVGECRVAHLHACVSACELSPGCRPRRLLASPLCADQ